MPLKCAAVLKNEKRQKVENLLCVKKMQNKIIMINSSSLSMQEKHHSTRKISQE